MSDAKTITFVWGDRGVRTGVVRMEWKDGWSLKQYLHTQPLKREGLLAKWKKSRVVNQSNTKLSLRYVPKQNDTVVFQRPGVR